VSGPSAPEAAATGTTNPDRVADLVRRDRLLVGGALVAITALSWAWLAAGAGMDMDMGGMDPDMVMPMEWTASLFAVMFLMWWIMMIAMMVPSAAPMILLFATVNRRQRAMAAPWVPTGIFAAGYLAAWAVYSGLATGLQWLLDRSGLMTMAMASAADWLGAVLLMAAGAWQLTPLKHACLEHCRSPFAFVSQHWRPGPMGAFRMGLRHGSYCVACCWAVMGLLFYAGVMNFAWIAGLAIFVLVEKLLPAGHRFGQVSGYVFLAWGLGLVVHAVVS
jgi:predicted metal-binding membrane protein